MLNITNKQGHANQNHNKTSLTSIRMAIIKNKTKQQKTPQKITSHGQDVEKWMCYCGKPLAKPQKVLRNIIIKMSKVKARRDS